MAINKVGSKGIEDGAIAAIDFALKNLLSRYYLISVAIRHPRKQLPTIQKHNQTLVELKAKLALNCS